MKRYTIDRANRIILRRMAASAVWQERGGRAIRESGKHQTGGAVVGRTVWVGMPEWAQGFGMSNEAIQQTVLKAICGRPLGRKQYSLIQAMLRELDEVYGSINGGQCPF